MGMKKYKIAVGICGPRILFTSVINAHDEREAIIKFLESEGEEITEESIKKYEGHVVLHTPKPRKKKTED